jgi:hypothetical protein
MRGYGEKKEKNRDVGSSRVRSDGEYNNNFPLASVMN